MPIQSTQAIRVQQTKEMNEESTKSIPLLIPAKDSELESCCCLPSTKIMNADCQSKYAVASPGVTTPTHANKWSPSATELTSTIPLCHSLFKLDSSLSDESNTTMVANDHLVENPINGSPEKDNRFIKSHREGCKLVFSNIVDKEEQKRKAKSSVELEIDLQAVKGIMGRSIIVKELDDSNKPQEKTISSSTLDNGGAVTSLQQKQKSNKMGRNYHSSMVASSKLPEFLQQRRASCGGVGTRRSSIKPKSAKEDRNDGSIMKASPSELSLFLVRRRASYAGGGDGCAKRSLNIRNELNDDNISHRVNNKPDETEILVGCKSDCTMSLLEEAVIEIIKELTSTTEKVENIEAEQHSNEDIWLNILDRTTELDNRLNKLFGEEESTTTTTENSVTMMTNNNHSSSSNDFSSLQTSTSSSVMIHDGVNTTRGGNDCITTYVTMDDDVRDTIEKLSDFYRKEIDHLKHMFVTQHELVNKQLVELGAENKELKKRLSEKFCLPNVEAAAAAEDTTTTTKIQVIENRDEAGCRCSVQ